jgi:predicted branched-subunit amino acid permease
MITPVAVAAFLFALSFGVLARAAGMGLVAPLVMSATTFAGSAQFAVASVLGSAGSAGAAIAAAAMLNARYAPIGISIAPAFHGSLPRRLLQSQLIVDETWAMTIRRQGGFDLQVLLGAGAVLYLCWNAGTAAGLILGNVIGDPNDLVAAALLGGGIALVVIPFTPAGVPIIAGAAGSLVGWIRG